MQNNRVNGLKLPTEACYFLNFDETAYHLLVLAFGFYQETLAFIEKSLINFVLQSQSFQSFYKFWLFHFEFGGYFSHTLV